MLRQISTADRPTDQAVLAADSSEILIGESQRDASPGEAAATHLPTPGPQKRAINRVLIGMTTFIRIQLRVGLPVAGMLRLTSMPAAADARQPTQHVASRSSEGRRTAQIRTCLKNEHPGATLREGHGSDTATGTGANDDRIPARVDVLRGRAHRQPLRYKKRSPEGPSIQTELVAGGRFELPTFGL